MAKNNYGWSDSLNVGNSRLDEEHKGLLAKMAQVEELNSKTFDKVSLLMAYDELVKLTVAHFEDEEQHMVTIAYPGALTHKRIHEALLEALIRYRAELTSSVHGRFPSAVFDFFKTWIITHIMIVDRQYYDFERAKNRASL